MFVDDLKRGEKAEMAAFKFYSQQGWFCRHSGKNKLHDLQLVKQDNVDEVDFIEAKFDNMSERTGNACFEMKDRHGKKSGLAGTKATTMFYMFPKDGCYEIDVVKMRAWIKDKNNDGFWQQKNGGDDNAFELALVPLTVLFDLDFVQKAIL